MFLNISLRKYYGTKQESKLNNYKCLPRMLVDFRFNLKQRKGVFFYYNSCITKYRRVYKLKSKKLFCELKFLI